MTKTIITGIIGLILIVAVIGGFIFLFDKVDTDFLDGDGVTTEAVVKDPTTSAPTTSAPTTSAPTTSAPSTSAPGGDSDLNIVYATGAKAGYVEINDYTYFFHYYDNTTSKTVFWKSHNNGEDVSDWDIKPYSSKYDLFIATSYDGEEWILDEYEFHDFPVRPGERCYISYTRVKDCTNPDYVLEELVQNVFTNSYYFNWRIDEAAG